MRRSAVLLLGLWAFSFCVHKGGVMGACEVNTSIISFREDVPPGLPNPHCPIYPGPNTSGTVIMRIPRVSGEQWAFREDGPRGFIELRALQHQVVFYFAREPDLEYLSQLTTLGRESLPFTLECSYDGWKHVFKQEIVLIDVNDNAPEFDPELPTTITVNENTSPGTVILDLRGYARDPDVTGLVNAYNISRHVDAEVINDGYEYFGVMGSGSELTLRQPVDFDFLRQMDRSFYVINLTAVDNGFPLPRLAHVTLTINISDSDDQGPAFMYPDCPMLHGFCTTPLYEAVLKISFTGVLKTWPGPIKAVDTDSINNSILYVIVSVAPEEYSSHVEMDLYTGEVRVTKAFATDSIDAIHISVKAEEDSPARRFITSTLRLQVIGDIYTSYNDRFRNVPVNDGVSPSQEDRGASGTVPISLFSAIVVVFFILILGFPFVVFKFLKGRLLSEQHSIPPLTPLARSGQVAAHSNRKESADTTTASILSCTSTDTACTTVFGQHGNDDDTNSDITSSSSTSSAASSNNPLSSAQLHFVDSVGFRSSLPDQTRRISSVAFDPEEIASRYSPTLPTRMDQRASDKLKRRLNELCSFHSCKDNKKSRVRFDIRNVSSFS